MTRRNSCILFAATLFAASALAQEITGEPQLKLARFDAASVRPCRPRDGGSAMDKSGRGSPGGRVLRRSPGRLYAACMTVRELVDIAYAQFGSDPIISDYSMFDTSRIRGGPGWVNSERYTINAETDNPEARGPTVGLTPASSMLTGTMLQALLENRFQLKTHRESEQVPMYALRTARGAFKLKPMEEGGCISRDLTKGVRVSEMFPSGEKPLCIIHTGWEGPNWTIDAAGQSLTNLAGALSFTTGRHVLDKTGIVGLYSFHLMFAHDDSTPGDFPPDRPSPFSVSDTSSGPSFFTVLEKQLGLKLVSDKGPRRFIVIDHVERPSEN
jgi:uncharacterized protein (TIGR03435 family)